MKKRKIDIEYLNLLRLQAYANKDFNLQRYIEKLLQYNIKEKIENERKKDIKGVIYRKQPR